MSNHQSSNSRVPRSNKVPLPSRLVAILLMVAGAVGFAVTLLVWGDRILFLLASTLVTFIGLGFIIAGRRLAVNTPKEGQPVNSRAGESRDDYSTEPLGKAVSTVNSLTDIETDDVNRQMKQRVLPLRRPLPTAPSEPLGVRRDRIMGEPPAIKPSLLNQVMDTLESSGAQVTVENQRAGRAILQFTTTDGSVYTGMVHDNLAPIEISELRSLQAMMNSRSSVGGFLFSSAPFSTQAYEWAASRKIRLVMADELDEISF